MRIIRSALACLAAVCLLLCGLPVQAEDYTTTFTYTEEYFVWNDPPDYCQWDADRWPGNKWGGSWQTKPLADSGSLIGDVSCTIFSTCDALSALLGIYIDPGDMAIDAYKAGVMSASGVDYTGTIYLAQKYNISYEVLDYSQVKDALLNGRPVVAFTHGSVFSASDHAICLFGYYEDRTLVRDPSHPELWTDNPVGGKWYLLDYIDQYSPNHVYVALGDGLPEDALYGLRSQFMEDLLDEEQVPQANMEEIEAELAELEQMEKDFGTINESRLALCSSYNGLKL